MRRPLTPDRQGTRLLAACAVVLALALGGATIVEMWQRRSFEEIERDHPGQGQLTVMVDATDALTMPQTVRLEDHLRRLVEGSLQAGDVVTIWRLGQSAEGPLQRVLRVHVPERHCNPLYQNPRETLEHFEVRLGRPLHAFLTTLLTVSPAHWSPILEAVAALADQPELHGVGARHLVLVSDLEQHSRFVSFLTHQPTFGAFRMTRTGRELPDLHGVDVDVVVIARPAEDLQLEVARERFWSEYLRAAGASRVRVERL